VKKKEKGKTVHARGFSLEKAKNHGKVKRPTSRRALDIEKARRWNTQTKIKKTR